MMEIPGEYGSGSGTIVRLSCALSALTGKEIRIRDIRSKRPNPGLRHQHLEVVRTIAKLCSAEVKGDEVGSKEIEFRPKTIKGGEFEVNIETAGSVGLLSYAVLIPAVFGKGRTALRIKGGSIASKWSPPVPYLENVLLPVLSKMGVRARFEIRKYGFYPVGGSEVVFEIEPCEEIKPVNLAEPGKIERIEGLSIASESLRDKSVAERQIKGFQRIIKEEADIKPLYVESVCPGSVLVVWARTTSGCVLAGDAVGERRKPSEVVGEEAGFKLKEEIEYESTVGEHLADQLIPFLALAKGKSEIIAPSLTDHVKTNMWLCERFLGTRFETREEGENVRIVCYGLS